jgi:hypothetical protein
MSPELDKVIRRIQKMLALAANNPNPHEAASAAAMAEKLMRKFQLDNADVMARDFRDADNFGTEDVSGAMKRNVGHKPKKLPRWVGFLAVPVAKLYDCGARCVRLPSGEVVIRFFGYKSDVACAAWCMDALLNTLITSVRAYQKILTRSKTESEDFRRGFSQALIISLHAAIADKERDLATHGNKSTALVAVKLNAVEEKYGTFGYRNANPRVAGRRIEDSYFRGFEEGAKVDVRGRALAGADSPARIR